MKNSHLSASVENKSITLQCDNIPTKVTTYEIYRNEKLITEVQGEDFYDYVDNEINHVLLITT
jgi:hypothetical protein